MKGFVNLTLCETTLSNSETGLIHSFLVLAVTETSCVTAAPWKFRVFYWKNQKLSSRAEQIPGHCCSGNCRATRLDQSIQKQHVTEKLVDDRASISFARPHVPRRKWQLSSSLCARCNSAHCEWIPMSSGFVIWLTGVLPLRIPASRGIFVVDLIFLSPSLWVSCG